MNDRRRRFEEQALPHLDAAYNLARWLSRSAADADDIVQDAMLRAFRAFDSLRGDDVKPWLLAIVRNSYLTAMRARRERGHLQLPGDGDTDEGAGSASPVDDDGPEAATIRAEEAHNLDTVIATLPTEFREVLVLREMHDLSYSEIATVTAVPIGTVMSRLARARAALKRRWLEGCGGPPCGLR
jgi:RNA polymerase sigma-70 factor (ECF subfamily)